MCGPRPASITSFYPGGRVRTTGSSQCPYVLAGVGWLDGPRLQPRVPRVTPSARAGTGSRPKLQECLKGFPAIPLRDGLEGSVLSRLLQRWFGLWIEYPVQRVDKRTGVPDLPREGSVRAR